MKITAMFHVYVLALAGAISTYFHKKAGVDASAHHSFMALLGGGIGVSLRNAWVQGEIKMLEANLAAMLPKAAGAAIVLALWLSSIGCSLSPQQIETDTAVGVNIALNGATIFEKSKAAEIKADATKVAQSINTAVLPQLQPSAPNAATLTNAFAVQTIAYLGGKLNTLPHWGEIQAAISLIDGPILGALANVQSPTAMLTPAQRMQLLAFFSGVSQGISTFTGDSTLAPPPLPSMPVIPIQVVPPPAPTPAPAPGTKSP